MSLDEGSLARVRTAFEGRASARELHLFGGTAFMVRGHMTVVVSPEGLLVRVGAEHHAATLREPHTRPMQIRGRPLRGLIFVDPIPREADALAAWVTRALSHNRTLPEKATPKARAPRSRSSTGRIRR